MLVSSLTKEKEEEKNNVFFWNFEYTGTLILKRKDDDLILQHALCLEHWTWQTLIIPINSTACLSLINIFCKAWAWTLKMKNTDSTCNNDGISRKQAKTTDRTCECTYTEGPSILGIRLLVRVLVIGLNPGPSIQNHWTGRISWA